MPDRSGGGAAAGLPLVSVVINNYNYGRYLSQAIDSALAQEYPRVEVVVIDDGSTDSSRDIIRSYGRGIVAVLKQNGGQASAFNVGVATARGSLIAFLDSDDRFLPHKIARCVETAARHPAADLIYHRMQRIDAEGAASGRPFPRRLRRGRIDAHVRKGGGTWAYAPTSGQVYRRAFLERIVPVPEEAYRISADAYVAGLAGMLTEVVSVEEVLAHYRVHGQNAYFYSGTANETEKLQQHTARSVIEADGLNAALARLGSPQRVDVADNFVYQLNLVKCGQGSIARLGWLTCRDLPDIVVRGKTIVRNLPAVLRRMRINPMNVARARVRSL
jgi:glycosyltransferase involved in cell wall biosynthesis